MTRLYLLTIAFLAINLMPQEVSAQCTNLFFSEYIEGSSNNKLLEIYNPTDNAVDLSGYEVNLYSNGATTPNNTLSWPAGTMLAAGDVYVIANSQSDSIFLAQADTTSTVTFYNGDDALALRDTIAGADIDIIGVIGSDPGSFWTVGTGSTQNHTLVRKSSVNEGQTNWAAGALEWAVFPINFADSLGFHNIENCELQSNAIASFSAALGSGSESVGSDTAFVTFSGITQNYTLMVEVLGSSTAVQSVDWNSAVVPASYTITPGQTELNLPFSIIDDALPEDSEFFTLRISEATGGLTIGNAEFTYTILDNDNPPTPACQFAFFSEYIEGSSNNKVLEIYNPTENTIDMGNYRILRYNNGTTDTSGMMEFPQGTIVAAGDVYVIANPSADSVFQAQADTTSTITFYNGDDALNLVFIPTNTSVDVFGVIGEDPGTNWPVNGGATSENTLIRDPSVQGGQTNWTLAAQTWIAFPSNFADSLGAHYMTPCGTLPGCDTTNIVINGDVTDESALGEEDGAIDISVSGGLPPYSFNWSNGAETEDISGIAPGSYTVTVTDFNGCTGTESFTVAAGPDPCAGVNIQLSTVVTNESVAGANDGAIDLTVSGGTPGYTFAWSNGAATEDISGLAPNVYTVTVTDAEGCTATLAVTVTAGPTGVNEIASLKLFSVYPNPASEAFAVALRFERPVVIQVSVTDVAGKVLYQSDQMRIWTAVLPIPAGWSSGLYFLKVISEGKLAVEPIMIY